jgi:hypothetical protein
LATDERVAAGAALRVGFVIGDVFVAGHAGRAVGAYCGFVNAVACSALAVALALGLGRNAMKPWELANRVTAGATGLRRHRATMRFVTGHALTMPLGAVRELFVVAASTSHHVGGLVNASFVARFTTRMP